MCVLGPLAPCIDISSDCETRVRSCADNREYVKHFMMENCKETCGFCGSGKLFQFTLLKQNKYSIILM